MKIKGIVAFLLGLVMMSSVFSFGAAAKNKLNIQYKWSRSGLKIQWDKYSGATRYNIKLTNLDNTRQSLILRNIVKTGRTVKPDEFDGLNVNNKYYVTVAAYNGKTKLAVSKITTRDIEVVGHRGAMDKAPQNTLAGLETAFSLGYDAVEADFFETVSGDILIFHDDFLNVCGKPEINVRTLNAAALKKYPIIKGNNVKSLPTQYIPTLAQFVKKAASLKLKIYLHMKDKNNVSDAGIKKIEKTLKKYKMLDRAVVFSSDKKACARIAKSKCHAGYLRVPKSKPSAKNAVVFARSVGAEIVLCQFNTYFSGEATKYAHKHGLKIGYYRVSNYIDAAKVTNRGADFFITDEDFLKN